ncbi:MAG TPA: Xaa-Pro peptidase family protein [Vicinamibacterales bacterium]|nr:Xaa-Pro peptidase family protein [Vicinamibacterales bacterium]
MDLWLVFLQETSVYAEPVLDYVIGQDVTWQSAFLYTAGGEAVAIVGNFDVDSFEARGCFDRVVGYTQGIGDDLKAELRRLNPRRIALNFAADNPAADGLTHGLYLLLESFFSELGMKDRVVSANAVVRSVRGRKTTEEERRLTTAVRKTEEAFRQLCAETLVGLTEQQIAARIHELAQRAGCGLAFSSIVNAGTKSALGHTQPGEARFEAGDLLHLDFGFVYRDYCADLQRCVYALRPGETAPPEELTRAFDAVAQTIQHAFAELAPGKRGCDIDASARKFIIAQGYPAYAHALGHQLGRSVHDGGALIGPEWARYGDSPRWPLEVGQVFTLELEATVPTIGYASLEEDVIITEQGARWLSTPQLAPELTGR